MFSVEACVPPHLSLDGPNMFAHPTMLPRIGTPRASACERLSRMIDEADSPGTLPSRSESKGLQAMLGIEVARE